jgi:FG-GAP-like repeat
MRAPSARKKLFTILLFLVAIFLLAASPSTLAATTNAPAFLPAVVYDSGGGYALSVAVADVNADEKPDIVVANWGSGTVGVLLGNGDGTFQPAVSYGSGGYQANSIAIADINGDGKPDLLVATGGSNTAGVLLGNGDGTFQPALTYFSGGNLADSVAVADVNGDGTPDLLVSNLVSSNIGVLLGNGDGTFQPVTIYGSGGFLDAAGAQLAVSDVNGDGRPDLVVVSCGMDGMDGLVGILLGNGDGTFQSALTYSSGGLFPRSIVAGDVNNDGKPDLEVTNTNSNTVGVLLGKGDGTFLPVHTYGSGGWYVEAVTVADVNVDGKSDLLVTNYLACGDGVKCPNGSVGLLLGDGNGTFQGSVSYGSGAQDATSVAVADVNGDGMPDLIVANYWGGNSFGNGSVGVLLNNSAPPDRTPPVITVSATPKVLWPPNGKLVPVTFSGKINDTASGVNSKTAAFAVKDEYGQIQPNGTVRLSISGTYSFSVLLQASRLGIDRDGRRYTITVAASDNAGNIGSNTTVVTVPHDQGH